MEGLDAATPGGLRTRALPTQESPAINNPTPVRGDGEASGDPEKSDPKLKFIFMLDGDVSEEDILAWARDTSKFNSAVERYWAGYIPNNPESVSRDQIDASRDPLFNQSKFVILTSGRASDRVRADVSLHEDVYWADITDVVPFLLKRGYVAVTALPVCSIKDAIDDSSYVAKRAEKKNIFAYRTSSTTKGVPKPFENAGPFGTFVPGKVAVYVQNEKIKEKFDALGIFMVNGPHLVGPLFPEAALKRILLPFAMRMAIIALLPEFLPDNNTFVLSFAAPYVLMQNCAVVMTKAAALSDLTNRDLPDTVHMHKVYIAAGQMQREMENLLTRFSVSTALRLTGERVRSSFSSLVVPGGGVGLNESQRKDMMKTVQDFVNDRTFLDLASYVVDLVVHGRDAIRSDEGWLVSTFTNCRLMYHPPAGTPYPRGRKERGADLKDFHKYAESKLDCGNIIFTEEDPTGLALVKRAREKRYDWPPTVEAKQRTMAVPMFRKHAESVDSAVSQLLELRQLHQDASASARDALLREVGVLPSIESYDLDSVLAGVEQTRRRLQAPLASPQFTFKKHDGGGNVGGPGDLSSPLDKAPKRPRLAANTGESLISSRSASGGGAEAGEGSRAEIDLSVLPDDPVIQSLHVDELNEVRGIYACFLRLRGECSA